MFNEAFVGMVKFDIISVFPEIFQGFTQESILGKAIHKKLISIKIHQLRKWAKDKHKMIDDRPFGGGPGMVLGVEPIYKAVQSLKQETGNKRQETKNEKRKTRVINFSPRGKKFTSEDAKRMAKYGRIIFICGRYEGVDERVSKKIADETFSIGDFITIGGEVPAMAVIESVSRHIPRVIGKKESVRKSDYPQYTRPEVFTPGKEKSGWKVPKVLLSGNHKKISEWREKNSF